MRSERPAKQKAKSIDWMTIILVLVLVFIGLVTIANVMAEPFTGEEVGFAGIREKLNLYYVQKQVVNFLVGLAAMLVLVAIDYEIFRSLIKYVYLANVALLAILLLTEKTTRGVVGWFTISTRAFQPSEICKITLMVMLAKLSSDIVEKEGGIKTLKSVGVLCLYFTPPFVLVLAQPDLGTAVVYLAIFVCILFISKISWKYILAAVGAFAAIAPLSYYYLFSDDQRNRINVFLNPGEDLLDAGMHVNNSKIAIGSGQMYGKGYFTEGTLAQLKHVPERHTDFIFSGIAEGFGFVGGTVLIVLYFLLIFRWFWVALRAKDHFGTCMAIGCVGMLLAHVFENIGMTIGLMPVTGIPLPFVSYGGSNMLTNMLAVGLILNVWMRRQVKR
ncbi:rod shape-determining protein RodA [Eubacteriales bacterium OttesenSCG-928-K08]|nr:rod shape-determining protein RodA [Eubacteriales bacterium OttesenSCG-928-K08]